MWSWMSLMGSKLSVRSLNSSSLNSANIVYTFSGISIFDFFFSSFFITPKDLTTITKICLATFILIMNSFFNWTTMKTVITASFIVFISLLVSFRGNIMILYLLQHVVLTLPSPSIIDVHIILRRSAQENVNSIYVHHITESFSNVIFIYGKRCTTNFCNIDCYSLLNLSNDAGCRVMFQC